jgi:hypothetical protein
VTDQNPSSDSHERRSVLKALGIGGLAATGVGAAAGSAAAAPQQDGTAEITGGLSGVDLINAATGNTAGTFESGTLSVDSLRIDRQTGDLLASGTIDGVLDSGQDVTQSFKRTTAQLDSQEGCTILTLDLGPLDLEVLGLRVQLNEIELDITGETGAGNLLGNLLCAIADIGAGGLSDLLDSVIGALNNLLNQLLG